MGGMEGRGQKEFLHSVSSPHPDKQSSSEKEGRASFVSGDGVGEGVFPLWSVLANIGLSQIARLPMSRLLSNEEEERVASPAAQRLRLDVDRLKSDILELSGGNQQK